MLTNEAVKKAIQAWPSRYRTREGRIVIGDAVSCVASALRADGWRNVGRIDRCDLKDLGLEIVEAEYINGARPTGKFVPVVVVKEATQ